MINIEEFLKVELKVGTVISCEEVEGSEKLLKLQIDLGEETLRQVLSGVRKWYTPEDFIGKQVVVIANLEPRKMMGLESQGMILAVDGEDGPVFLAPAKEVKSGSKVR